METSGDAASPSLEIQRDNFCGEHFGKRELCT
jgi:hypothetical protein